MIYPNIRSLREDSDLKPKDLAKVLNIVQNTYSQYERGKIAFTDEILITLADFYHTSVDCLLGHTQTKAPYPFDEEQKKQ